MLKLGGYSHKLPTLLSAILAKLASLRGRGVRPERFEIYRQQQALDYNNFWRGQPYAQAGHGAGQAPPPDAAPCEGQAPVLCARADLPSPYPSPCAPSLAMRSPTTRRPPRSRHTSGT